VISTAVIHTTGVIPAKRSAEPGPRLFLDWASHKLGRAVALAPLGRSPARQAGQRGPGSSPGMTAVGGRDGEANLLENLPADLAEIGHAGCGGAQLA
jgi:hypothetical protein